MASLLDAVKMYAEELRLGIAWVAFWREGRSWKSDCLFLNPDSETIQPDDLSSCVQAVKTDSRAVVLNGYYCGRLGENMTLGELAAGVRWHYENGYNALADFLEAHSGAGFVIAEERSEKQNHNMIDGVIDGGPPRVNQGYTVIATETVGCEEVVLAHSPTAPDPFVTWERNIQNDEQTGREDFYWGKYFSTEERARENFHIRVEDKREMLSERRSSILSQLKSDAARKDLPAMPQPGHKKDAPER